MIVWCSNERSCNAASVPAETGSNLVIRSCLNFAKFLCLDLADTNHIQIAVPTMRHVGGFPFEVSTVTFGNYEFWIEKNGIIRFFWVKERRELDDHARSCPTPPPAQDIRDFLCPNVNFTKEPDSIPSGPSQTGSTHYNWGREESRDLIRGPKFYWEWVYVEVDARTQRCLKVQNTVKVIR